MIPSSMEISTFCPSPVFWRRYRAPKMPIVAKRGAMKSEMGDPTFAGPVRGSPVIPMSPPMAWMMGSMAGRSR